MHSELILFITIIIVVVVSIIREYQLHLPIGFSLLSSQLETTWWPYSHISELFLLYTDSFCLIPFLCASLFHSFQETTLHLVVQLNMDYTTTKSVMERWLIESSFLKHFQSKSSVLYLDPENLSRNGKKQEKRHRWVE